MNLGELFRFSAYIPYLQKMMYAMYAATNLKKEDTRW